jgi:dipeptidyl aminopeptidase/acylaminoacyl peptidase
MDSMLRSFFKIRIYLFIFLWGFVSVLMNADQNDLYKEGYLMPPEAVRDILDRDRHFDILSNLSPDKDHVMIPVREDFSSLELMAQKTYRLGMLEICPDVNREWRLSTYGVKGLKIFSIAKKKSWAVRLPEGVSISDMVWSPDGEKIAFLAHLRQGTQVWIAGVETGKAEPLSETFVMATLAGRPRYRRTEIANPSQMLQWTPKGSLITLLVPENRGSEPEKNSIPDSPIIRHTREKATPTPTYPFLLRTSYDRDLFRYYTRSQLAELEPGKAPRVIGPPAMYMNISLSPDGQYILAETLKEPFSHIVSYTNFPRELLVMDRSGKVLSSIRKIPLQEAAVRRGREDPLDDLPRDVAWRPDGKGLSFLWRVPKSEADKKRVGNEEENEKDELERKDRLMHLSPPFDLNRVQVLVTSQKEFKEVSFALDGRYAFAKISGRSEDYKKGTDIVAFDLSQTPPRKLFLLKDIEEDDPLEMPGDILKTMSGNGMVSALTSSDGGSVYLQGEGYREDFKHRPFIDRIAIEKGTKERIFESAEDLYERPLVPLDEDLTAMIISRESRTVFPDSWLWRKDGTLTRLTANRNPFPEFTDCKREDFVFERRDGLEIRGRLSLPVGYGTGDKAPAVFWTYPREYETFRDYRRASLRSHNLNAYLHLNTRNASDIWLSQGYAVVVPDIPIIGKDEAYNNNYIAHLVDSMYAAIRKVDELGYVDIDRLGHGGHSYGAFATANILAHTPFFKAGIAGDGAYNRTLTPMTFQNEERFIWEAQDIYLEMSPFFQADHIDTPLLMYHGAADDNTGTFLIQSERLIQALTGLGKNAVLYIYPFESHGPRCKETYMDMWARWLSFFNKYVKKR